MADPKDDKSIEVTNHTGLVLCLVAVLINTLMDTVAKFATGEVSTWQMVSIRWGFGLILILPFILKTKRISDWDFRRKVHIYRLSLNTFASLCLFYALKHLPLGIVVTIFFTEPLVTMVFSAFLLKEKISAFKWTCAILSFVCVIIVSPSANTGNDIVFFNPDVLVAFLGAFSWGLMRVLTKKHRHETSTLSLMFWMAFATSIISIPGAVLTWKEINGSTLLIIFAVAGLGNIYNYTWLQALKISPASYIANFFYLLLPLSFLAGYLAFDEIPTTANYIGSLCIFALVFASSHHKVEAKLTNILMFKNRHTRRS